MEYEVIERKIAREAIKLLRKGWTKGYFAARGNGEPCGYASQDAARFCLEGAIYRAARDLDREDMTQVLLGKLERILRQSGQTRTLPHFNDEQGGVQSVIDFLKKAVG